MQSMFNDDDNCKYYKNTFRLVTHSLGVHHLHLADGSRNALDLCGFDNGIPKVLEAFTKGLF